MPICGYVLADATKTKPWCGLKVTQLSLYEHVSNPSFAHETSLGQQVQQQLEGQVWAAASDLQQTAPVPTISSPRASPRLLGRTATPARSNLLQLLTGDTNEVMIAQARHNIITH